MMTKRSCRCRKRFLTRLSVGGLCPKSLLALGPGSATAPTAGSQRSPTGVGCQWGQVPTRAAPLLGPGNFGPGASRWPSGYDGVLKALVGRRPHTRGSTLVPTVAQVRQAALQFCAPGPTTTGFPATTWRAVRGLSRGRPVPPFAPGGLDDQRGQQAVLFPRAWAPADRLRRPFWRDT